VDVLPAILDEVPPLPGEEAMYAQFRAVLDAVKNDAKLKEAFTKAAIDADNQLVHRKSPG
jgi:hypothetical protein